MISGPAASSSAPLLSVHGLAHSFSGVRAVAGVDLEFCGGEVCALVGENGAGKSTLMRAVAGALRPDRGEVRLDGRPLPQGDPGGVRRRGITLLHQELELIGPLPVDECIALGREARRGWLVDRKQERSEASRLLARLGARIDPDAPAESLSLPEQQMVAIARALAEEARVLILDEPTSALSAREAERLLDLVRALAGRGAAVIYITHRLEETFRAADRIVVMRDGSVVADGPRARFDPRSLIAAMVGRPLDRQFPERRRRPAEVRLRVDRLSAPPDVAEASLEVRAGEIVALAGLIGAGRTRVGRLLYGADRPAGGAVLLDGMPVSFHHPAHAVRAGVGWASEDRKGEGLLLSLSLIANLTLPHLGRYRRAGGWLDEAAGRRDAERIAARLPIRGAGLNQPVAALSGGNQQKVALARWLLHDCRLLICDEPTRGVDVAGRFELYELLEEMACRGAAILMISSDLPEVLGMADRIVVMRGGRTVADVPAAGATQEAILQIAMGAAA